MHLNILDLDRTVNYVLADPRWHSIPQRGIEWARRAMVRELQGPDYKLAAQFLRINVAYVVTQRELRLLTLMEEARPSVCGSVAFYEEARDLGIVHGGILSYGSRFPSLVISRETLDSHPWLVRALEAGNDVISYRPSTETTGRLHHLAEALCHMLPVTANHLAVSLDRAQEYADAWQKQLERQAREREGQIKVVGETPNYTLVKLEDEQALLREGYLMKHCVGSYELKPGRSIYSLRHGSSIYVTVETKDIAPSAKLEGRGVSRVIQIQGPVNSRPSDEQVEAVLTILAQFSHVYYNGQVQLCSASPAVSESTFSEEMDIDHYQQIQAAHALDREQIRAAVTLEIYEEMPPLFRGEIGQAYGIRINDAPAGALYRANAAGQPTWQEVNLGHATTEYVNEAIAIATATATGLSANVVNNLDDGQIDLLIVKLRQRGANI